MGTFPQAFKNSENSCLYYEIYYITHSKKLEITDTETNDNGKMNSLNDINIQFYINSKDLKYNLDSLIKK